MKKNLIALAVAGAMVVPMTAMADVKIFGAVKYELGQYNNGVDDAHLMQRNVGSRLGFSGSEDLGNGLKGIFRIQGNFNGTGAGLNTGEETWVGLTGDFGTLRLGRHNDATKKANAAGGFRVFGDTMLDVGGNTTATTGISLRPAHWARQDGIHYSNKFGAANVNATIAPTGNENKMNLSASMIMPVGPVSVGLGYASVAETLLVDSYNTWLVNATYKAGDLSVGALYEKVDEDAWITVPVTYTMGANMIRVAYQKRSPDVGDDVTGYGLGFMHNFSKRTNAYVNYGATDTSTGAIDDPRVFSVGVEHKF